MNVLFIHENDWIKKIIYEPHHLSEIFSMKGHNVFAIDCQEPDSSHLGKNLKTQIINNYNKVYDNASITLIHPPSLVIKGLNRLTNFLTCKNVIRDTVERNHIDIIFLYGVATNGLQALSVANEFKIPIVFRELDISHEFVEIPFLKQITKIIEKKILSNVTKVYSCTPGLQRYSFQMGTQKENSEYFPLGINTNIFKPMNKDEKLAESLGIKSNDKVIIFVGTLYSFSGLEYLISNFSKIKSKIPEIKFLIVGGGPDYYKIKNLILNQNLQQSIILINFVSQKILSSYIALADLCLNSFETTTVTNEIIPIKILEYMACQKPVLSTPLKGTKELLPSKDYGIIYSELSDFHQAITDLLTNTDELFELSKKGHTYSRENHDWAILSSRLIAKFEKLISK
tara:strand:- start:64 stop:1260 length:1197 start_codon:yes stop_codon:yes gene_type:complete